jgi:CRISPR/Cas system-associated exonuclease Cas4 (RecB family)
MLQYSQLRERASQLVREFAANGPVLVLAPERAAADEVVRLACTKALLGVDRFGFRELAPELAAGEMNRLGLAPVGRIIREALAARVAARTELTYLKPAAAFPGFPRALAVTFEELRLNRITPAQLGACGQSGSDLANLLAAYEEELTDRRFADHALRVKLALAHADLKDMALIVLDVAPRTRLERELLEAVKMGARAAADLRPSPVEDRPSTSLESLQRFLFSAAAVPQRADDGTVEIFSTSGEALECVEIARRIVQAAVPFDEIAILLRSPERHQPLVIEALRRAGIPAHCTHGTARPDVAGRSFLALLYCAEEGLSASRFAEYLSLNQMRDDEEPHTPALWERLLVDAAVIGGPERWRTRLRGLREELVRRYRDSQDSAIERRVATIDNLGEVALPIVDRLAELPRRARWGEWIEVLTDLAEFTLREPNQVIELLDELEPMGDIGPIELRDVLLVIGAQLNTLRAGPKEARYGKVWIGGIDEARGMAFRHAYVPGLNEGLFPRPPAEDPLLWQSQRDALGIELRADDSELLRVAVACASERVVLSFSRLDLLTGRERVPSFYAFAAHRAAGGADIDVRQFEERARAATETKIGWPAPKDPADAIDDAEYDLATLAPRAPGSGQYLNRLAGRAIPALRARWMRWHKPWKAADGLLIEEIGSDALKAFRLAAKPWSPSALQQYARCPYHFALHGIFGLRPQERPQGIQRLDPATQGQIFHEVQFQLLRDGGENARERLDAVLREVTDRWKDELAPAIPQIWDSEVQSLRADLRGWLQHRAESEPGWMPIAAELSFGLADPAGRDPKSRKEPAELDGVLLKGSIDLVERHSSGMVRVVDHKTGRPPEPRPEMVGGGEALQPALYALAAEQMLAEPVQSGRLYYSTVAQNYTSIDVPLNEWTRRRTAQVLTIIDGAIRDGFLPAAPRRDACKGCDYLPVCGPYEEERVAAKSQAELGRLKELRGWR